MSGVGGGVGMSWESLPEKEIWKRTREASIQSMILKQVLGDGLLPVLGKQQSSGHKDVWIGHSESRLPALRGVRQGSS